MYNDKKKDTTAAKKNSEPSSPIPKDKKKARKSKKTSEKEILKEYYTSTSTPPPIEKAPEKPKRRGRRETQSPAPTTSKTEEIKSLYENYQYLSTNEKLEFDKKFTKPINANQEEYVATLKNKNKKIIIVSGPAGTGKTLFATEFGIRYFLMGYYDKLIFTRPSVSVDEDLGYLPGTMEEKMAPWVRPIYDILHNFISPKEVLLLMEEKSIEIAPLGHMRGRTFKNSWIVADEMQNSTVNQMKMLLTRMGTNSRLVITGDLEQFDKPSEINGLEDFLNKFRGRRSSSISSFEFNKNDIQREEVVKEVLQIYSHFEIPNPYIHNDSDVAMEKDDGVEE